MNLINYFLDNFDLVLSEMARHLEIIFLSLPFSILIGVTLGVVVANNKKTAKIVVSIANIFMTIPSLALFGIMVVLLSPINAGIGVTPAVISLIIYSLLPIIKNTLIAINSLDKRTIEAAKGMGMTSKQILFRIRLPLSVPIIMSGIRNAVVMGVGVATMGYFVSSGGLGYFIFSGLGRSRYEMVVLGVILISILGVLLNYFMLKIEDMITPKGLKIK